MTTGLNGCHQLNIKENGIRAAKATSLDGTVYRYIIKLVRQYILAIFAFQDGVKRMFAVEIIKEKIERHFIVFHSRGLH